jgi:hypothetical protein
MPVTGYFGADFSDFNTAVQGAEVTLKGFEDNAGRIKDQLTRMGNSLSGTTLIQDATLMAQAVKDAGGASTLTANELARVSSMAAEAAEKMRALGMTVPDSVQKLADAAVAATTNTEGFAASVTALVAAGAAAEHAIDALVTIGLEWIDVANEQEDATVRLDSALRATGSYTPELTANYAALATQFAATTVNSKAALTNVEAMLVTIGGVLPQNMEAALKATTDLAAGMRIDLPSAAAMMAKALEGNTTAFHKAGIEINAVALQTQGITAIFDAIEAKMSGDAAAQVTTFSGQMNALGKEVSSVKELFGNLLEGAIGPFIEMFRALPEPVQQGGIALGILGGVAGTAGVALGALASLVKVAAPMLGFAEAVEGATSVGLLGTAIGALAVPLGIATAAVGAWWVAWKVGNWESVKNYIAEVELRAEGMSVAEAHAAVSATAAAVAANEHAKGLAATTGAAGPAKAATMDYTAELAREREAVDDLFASEKEEILAAKELGATDKELEKQYKLTHAQIQMIVKDHQDQEQASKQAAAQAQRDADAFAKEWTKTAKDTTKVWDEYYTALADADSKSLAGRLNVIEAKHQAELDAAAETIQDQSQLNDRIWAIDAKYAALKIAETKKTNETINAENAKLWAEYSDLVAQESGSAYDKATAAIDKWYADLVAKTEAAGNANAEFWAASSALVVEKYRQAGLNIQEINKVTNTDTQAGLQATADAAKRMADYAVSQTGIWSAAVIEKYQTTANAAQVAANSFGTGWNDNADKALAAIQKVTQTHVTGAQEAQKVWEQAAAAALHADNMTGIWSADQIAKFHEIADTAKATADAWGQSFENNATKAANAIDMLERKLDATKASIQEITTLSLPQAAGSAQEQADLKAVMAQVSQSSVGRMMALGSTDVNLMNQYEKLINDLMAARGYQSNIAPIKAPGFASGGTVGGGMPIVVGEKGAELFVPMSDGTILPHGTAPGGSSVVIHNTFQIVDTESNIARRVSDTLTRQILQGVKVTSA